MIFFVNMGMCGVLQNSIFDSVLIGFASKRSFGHKVFCHSCRDMLILVDIFDCVYEARSLTKY